MNNDSLFSIARNLCNDHGHKLLYLVRFGSELYGTNTQNSDTDVKGIFLPSKKSLLLGQKCQHLNFKTGNDKEKNSKDDVDLQLWSIHHFFHLIQLGDTNALDLLYAHTNAPMVIFRDLDFMSFLRGYHDKFYNRKKLHGYLGYILGQAKKYGLRGSRVGVIKRVKEWLDSCHPKVFLPGSRLGFWASTILEKCEEPSYCFPKEVNGSRALVICGKVHLNDITMTEFQSRIERDYERYGERARLAEQNEGIDWKAIHHAARAGVQMLQLLKYRRISFPLEEAAFLKEIKAGAKSWKECEQLLIDLIEEVKTLQDALPEETIDTRLIEEHILNFYDEGFYA